jgi:adenylate cyclase
MIEAYRARRWTDARRHAERAAKMSENINIAGLYDLYLNRITNFEANPPPKDWDGVHVAESK